MTFTDFIFMLWALWIYLQLWEIIGILEDWKNAKR